VVAVLKVERESEAEVAKKVARASWAESRVEVVLVARCRRQISRCCLRSRYCLEQVQAEVGCLVVLGDPSRQIRARRNREEGWVVLWYSVEEGRVGRECTGC
jgi:hypothetical protein